MPKKHSPQSFDLASFKAIALAATQGEWYPGCFTEPEGSCQCRYVFSPGYMGSIAEISVSNNLPISEGGNDSPPEDEARANLIYIATFDPETVLALIEMAEASTRERVNALVLYKNGEEWDRARIKPGHYNEQSAQQQMSEWIMKIHREEPDAKIEVRRSFIEPAD